MAVTDCALDAAERCDSVKAPQRLDTMIEKSGFSRADCSSASGWEPGRTADPSASPDFLSQVAASVSRMWFSLERTTPAALVKSVR
ncbi:MAG: hypothetical protein QOH35_3316 [Acidobacteriaceae bacterium]|nr:hypothetical protein [Acidobacteriaceae bacterium]